MKEALKNFLRLLGIAIVLMIGVPMVIFGIVQFVNRMVGVARVGGVGPVTALLYVAGGMAFLAAAYPLLRKMEWVNRGLKPANGRVGTFLADVDEVRSLAGREFVVHYRRPKKGKHGHPSSLVVQVPVATPMTLKFNRENAYDRWAKGVGIASEVQTEDTEFDEEVYVRGPSAEYAARYLTDADKRLAVRGLLTNGFKEVRLTGTHAAATWVGFDPLKNDQPELADYAAAGLFVLAGRLPEVEPGQAAASDPTRNWNALLWIFIIAFAATILIGVKYPPVRTGELFSAGVIAFVLMYPAFVLLSALLLRGASNSHDRWGLLAVVGVPLVLLGSIGATQCLNFWADDSPLHKRPLVVANKREGRTSKGGRTYHVTVADWARPGQTLQFAVSSWEFQQVVPGQSHLDLTTGDGWLGIEWLKEQRVRGN